MKVIIALLLLVWMFQFLESIQSDESLSFSMPVNSSILPTPSYWHGTIPSVLFENDLRLNIYLNKPQGLLFYAIDNFYKSFWIEFEETNMIISYYTFQIEDIFSVQYDLKTKCKVQSNENIILKLKFSLYENYLTMKCNTEVEKIFYSPDTQLFQENTKAKFLAAMKKPVPNFNSYNKSVTFVWIGNIPIIATYLNYNSKLKLQQNHFIGCVELLKEGFSAVKLATTGIRQGNMIEPFCNHVCDTNPCYNNVKCSEQWRLRFSCDCGLTHFVGPTCNETYDVEFDGRQFIEIKLLNKFRRLQVNFKIIFPKLGFQGAKILSIKFVFDQFLIIYIDNRRYINTRFITYSSQNIESQIDRQLQREENVTLIIGADNEVLKFELIDYQNIVTVTEIRGTFSNLRMEKILVADSYTKDLIRMKKFEGCISNLMVTSNKGTFLWNTITNYSNFPKCGNKKINLLSQYKSKISQSISKSRKYSNISAISNTNNKSSSQQKNVIIIIVVVAVIILVAIIITTILKFKNNRSKKRKSITTREQLIPNNVYSFTSNRNNSIQGALIPFKPAYKAGSSVLSLEVRSVLSLPASIREEEV